MKLHLLCYLQGLPKKIWKLGKLNHVAIAVPDIDKATAFYRDILGAKVSEKYVSIICSIYYIINQECAGLHVSLAKEALFFFIQNEHKFCEQVLCMPESCNCNCT